MKSYVINLKTSIDRRQYMEKLLKPYNDFLDVNFIEAVDGRILSDKELNEIWNQDGTYNEYGRYMKGGEIGVALSQRKCYEEIIKNRDDMALIFEDDVVFKDGVDLRKVLDTLKIILQTNEPTIILLSGSYWFTKTLKITDTNYKLASVFEAMGAMSYLVNQSAARIMLNMKKVYLADDWYSWKRKGVNVYALHPHIAGDMDLFSSVIASGYEGLRRKNLPLLNKLRAYYRGVIRYFLGMIGKWEPRSVEYIRII